MRQQVLKALANPSRIFYVPYPLAVLNFIIQFGIYIIVFIIVMITSGGSIAINPIFFLLSVIAVHSFIAGFSKKEPQLANIVSAKVSVFLKRIPGRLAP